MEEDPAHLKSEEKTIENILKYENSAAALCFRLKKRAEAKPSDPSLTKDVIGIVATLGKVNDLNLSRPVHFLLPSSFTFVNYFFIFCSFLDV